ncbi:unnamed protein product [Symbiodinium natans]|uniref:Uncharacterized protein n=1 Tax=Symbiodinium natans TaxID=878477 RepID=A0A812UWX4_9DINO|nr:unnamed protein product [Symbiodinium natans]
MSSKHNFPDRFVQPPTCVDKPIAKKDATGVRVAIRIGSIEAEASHDESMDRVKQREAPRSKNVKLAQSVRAAEKDFWLESEPLHRATAASYQVWKQSGTCSLGVHFAWAGDSPC